MERGVKWLNVYTQDIRIYLWWCHVYIQFSSNQQSDCRGEACVGFHDLGWLLFNDEGAANLSHNKFIFFHEHKHFQFGNFLHGKTNC